MERRKPSLEPPFNEVPLDTSGHWTRPWLKFFDVLAEEIAETQALAASTSYADDAAAAVGGVPIGKFYRTGSAVKVRVA